MSRRFSFQSQGISSKGLQKLIPRLRYSFYFFCFFLFFCKLVFVPFYQRILGSLCCFAVLSLELHVFFFFSNDVVFSNFLGDTSLKQSRLTKQIRQPMVAKQLRSQVVVHKGESKKQTEQKKVMPVTSIEV